VENDPQSIGAGEDRIRQVWTAESSKLRRRADVFQLKTRANTSLLTVKIAVHLDNYVILNLRIVRNFSNREFQKYQRILNSEISNAFLIQIATFSELFYLHIDLVTVLCSNSLSRIRRRLSSLSSDSESDHWFHSAIVASVEPTAEMLSRSRRFQQRTNF